MGGNVTLLFFLYYFKLEVHFLLFLPRQHTCRGSMNTLSFLQIFTLNNFILQKVVREAVSRDE
jgi:hypothetical protein